MSESLNMAVVEQRIREKIARGNTAGAKNTLRGVMKARPVDEVWSEEYAIFGDEMYLYIKQHGGRNS